MVNMSSTCVPHIKIFITISLFSTTMSTKRVNKRKKGPWIVGESVELAHIVTPKIIHETKADGTTVTKRVLVSLDKPKPKAPTMEKPAEMPETGYEPIDMNSPPPERLHTYPVSVNNK
jgi:hypothetical protein